MVFVYIVYLMIGFGVAVESWSQSDNLGLKHGATYFWLDILAWPILLGAYFEMVLTTKLQEKKNEE